MPSYIDDHGITVEYEIAYERILFVVLIAVGFLVAVGFFIFKMIKSLFLKRRRNQNRKF